MTRDARRPQRHIAIIERKLVRVFDRAAAIGPATVEVIIASTGYFQ